MLIQTSDKNVIKQQKHTCGFFETLQLLIRGSLTKPLEPI